MYTLKEIENDGLRNLELANSDNASKAQICLNQGGQLNYLVFENVQVLTDFLTSTYKNNYASSVLFPFANRIKDGEYIKNIFYNSSHQINPILLLFNQ